MTLRDICILAHKHGVTISISGETSDDYPVVKIDVKKSDFHCANLLHLDDFRNYDTLQYAMDDLIYRINLAAGTVTCELCSNKAPHLIPIFKQERGEFHKYNVCPECEYKHSQELAATRENFNRQFGEN